ncbi:uncharacterized protein LOC122655434 [Telopea speciosissima]|uniref:uncharacterized protein LOC122655434 n=1 Tax=Telopea speciosissima TaxID=54955 RepID=UPI001CC67195|nr:uncharacterized protein LOC122655434 [Telopea speciosissima]
MGGETTNSRKQHVRNVLQAEATIKKRRTDYHITFTDENLANIQSPHDDAMVIKMVIANCTVGRILVNNGSSVDILYYDAFEKMLLKPEMLKRVESPLYGFNGAPIQVEGSIELLVTVGIEPKLSMVMMNFLVVKVNSTHNGILGRPGHNTLQAVVSTPHLVIKFPTDHGVGECRGSQAAARRCYKGYLRTKGKEPQMHLIHLDDNRDIGEQERNTPAEELIPVEIVQGDATCTIQIGAGLNGERKSALINFLRINADVFAWCTADMPGIDRKIAEHRLSVYPTTKPMFQKKRTFALEQQEKVIEEVTKLLDAGFIEEAIYPEWLSNVVMVPKPNGKWRMCIDFTDLNKACPKDYYPLPRINLLIDATAGHEMISFMDAYSGYNQIRMYEPDILKTSFIAGRDTYCYIRMPFGLKNAGASYQRLINYLFRHQIGHNVEVYVDDMLVKSLKSQDHIADLNEAFQVLRESKMRLNPAKCAFGVISGKFLGFMVSRRGIEANPSKIKAILEMHRPRRVKELQELMGRIAALGRFISTLGDRCLPFFKALKNRAKERKTKGPKLTFEWTEECQTAFTELKRYMAQLPLLTKPEPGDTLQLYSAITIVAISAILVRGDGRIQKPIYYVSKVLLDAETRYSSVEKYSYALIMVARKLRPYFQAYTIEVITNQPLKKIPTKPDHLGRLVAWCVELGEFDIHYKPRTAIKAQTLVDFVVECTLPEEEIPSTADPKEIIEEWTLYVDGSSSAQGCGASLILTSPRGFLVQYALRFEFQITNNGAEYEALIAGLKLAQSLMVKHITVHSDSQLIVNQVKGEYEAKESRMAQYLRRVQDLITSFNHFEILQVPQTQNASADAFSKLATSNFQDLSRTVYLDVLSTPSIEQSEEVLPIEVEPCWMDLLVNYLQEGILPTDKEEAKKVRIRDARYTMIGGTLYKKAFAMPYLKCLRPSEVEYVLREIHTGICGQHLRGIALAHKVIRHGYFWPYLCKEAPSFVRKCLKCQKFAPITRQPATELTSISSPLPFVQ